MQESKEIVQEDTSLCEEVVEASGEPRGGCVEQEPEGVGRLVPVSEAIRYRRRAQSAEQELGEFKERLENTRVELDQAEQTISCLERRQKIDALLADAEAVDLDVARLLTEAAVEIMDEADVQLAIDDLRRHKPYLFKSRGSDVVSMPARMRDRGDYQAGEAAERAAVTGDRQDLLRYLRLRRRA